jgi:hypothetical protein
MRFSTTLLILPALVLAQEQKPLGDFGAQVSAQVNSWFEKAKAYIPPAIYSPTAAVAAKVASKNVVHLHKDNWQETLVPSTTAKSTGPDNWMVLISGGNKTCYGKCEDVERAWNESAALFAVDPTAPHLGYIDCEADGVLCAQWATGPAAIYYIEFQKPTADQSKPSTTVHIVKLNTTSVTAKEIVEIHTKKTYENEPAYEGYFHPFDGLVAQYGLTVPVGWLVYGYSLIPSWLFMISISFITRTFM